MQKVFFFILSFSMGLLGCQEKKVRLCEDEDFCQMSFYPNPTTGPVTLLLTSDVVTTVEISVINFQGQKLINEEHEVAKQENEIQLDLSTLDVGIYLIHLEAEESDTRITQKLLKKNS